MRRWTLPWILLLGAVLVGQAWSQTVLPRDVRERILQAVVEVRPHDSAANQFVGSAGSGTIVSPDGYVLTNFHVVGDNDTGRAYEWHGIFVTDPRAPDQAPAFRYWARYVAGDPRHDLAIVQIVEDADQRPLPTTFAFVSMPVGDSNTLIPGDPITVVGYPGISGATITFTSGIVSGFLGEDLQAGGKQWIKTDAKLARGNSGGAAFDENGLLVGVPTLRTQTTDGAYIEQQDYLRPIALAWPLLTAHVANVNRVGGVGSAVASVFPTPAPLAPSTTTTTPPATPPAVAAGIVLSERGVLAPGDGTMEGGEFFDRFVVHLTAGVPYTVSLSSSAFDAYLGLVGPDGQVALEVDDSPGHGSDVLETYVPATSGSYTVIVTSYAAGETGAYLLEIRGGAGATASTPPATPGTPGATVLLAERGTLAPGDLALDSGEYVDVYAVDLSPGTTVWFELNSSEFDAYLVVLGPTDEVVLEVDDSAGHGLNVAASLQPPVAGRYLVAVTSAFAGETGAYDLTVRIGGEAPIASAGTPAAVGAGTGVVGPLTLGQMVRSELAGAGERISFHTYYVDVPVGSAQLVVEMTADVDLDLFLKHGSEIVSLGDDGDWDFRDVTLAPRATFSVPAPSPGRWYVDVVWVAGGDGTARYSLRAR